MSVIMHLCPQVDHIPAGNYILPPDCPGVYLQAVCDHTYAVEQTVCKDVF